MNIQGKTMFVSAHHRGNVLKRLLIALGVLVILLAVFVAAAPTLFSGLVSGKITKVVSKEGVLRMEIGKLSLSWLGEQKATDIVVLGQDGSTVADVDVVVPVSISSVIFGNRNFDGIKISGDINLQRDAQGILNTQPQKQTTVTVPVLKSGKSGRPQVVIGTGSPGNPGEIKLPKGVTASLDFSGLNINYKDLRTGSAIKLKVKEGKAVYNPTKPITLNIKAETSGTSAGEIIISAKVENFTNAQGVIDTNSALTTLNIVTTNLPTEIVDSMVDQNGLLVDAMGDKVNLQADMKGGLQQGSANVHLQSPNLNAVADLILKDGTLLPKDDAPLSAQITLTDSFINRLAPDTGSHLLNEKAQLTLNVSDLYFPLDFQGAKDKRGLRDLRFALNLAVDPLQISTDLPEVKTLTLDGWNLNLGTSDLEQGVNMEASGKAAAGSDMPGTVLVQLHAGDLLDADGKLSPTNASMRGEAKIVDMPSSIITPFISKMGIEPARDIGPTINLTLTGWQTDDGKGSIIVADLDTNRIRGELSAELKDGYIRSSGKTSTLTFEVSPELMTTLAGRNENPPLTFTGKMSGSLSLENFDILLPGKNKNFNAADMRASLQVNGPMMQISGSEQSPVKINDLVLNLHTDESGKANINIDGSYNSGNAAGKITGKLAAENIAAFTAGKGKPLFDLLSELQPSGTINIQDIPLAPVLAVMNREKPGNNDNNASPDTNGNNALFSDIIAGLAGDSADIALKLTPTENALNASVNLSASKVNAGLNAALQADQLAITDASGTLTLPPRVVEKIMADISAGKNAGSDQSDKLNIRLLSPARLSLTVQPMKFPVREGKPDLSLINIAASVSTDNTFAVDGLPGTKEPVQLDKLTANLNTTIISGNNNAAESKPLSLRAQAALSRSSSGKRLGLLKVESLPGSAKETGLNLRLENVNVAELEPLLGREKGELVGFLGPNGGLVATLVRADTDADHLDLDLAFKRLQGKLSGKLADEVFALTKPADLSVVVSPEILTNVVAAMNQPKESEKAKAKPAPLPFAFTRAATVKLNLRKLQLNTKKPLDPRVLQADAQLSVNQVQGKTIDDLPFAYRDVTAAVQTQSAGTDKPLLKVDLRGYSLSQKGTAGKPALDIHLLADKWITTEGKIDTEKAALTGNIAIQNLSMALLDAVTGSKGILAAALGRNATITADLKSFSRESGTVNASLISPNGTASIVGSVADHVLTTSQPIDSKLIVTEQFSDLVLSDLIPMFILHKSAEDGPVHLKVDNLTAPLDGDLRKLNAIVDLDIGGATYTLREPFNSLVAATQNDVQGSVKQVIPPIHMTIRDGVVRYADLPLVINRTRLMFTGRINLATRRMRLDTEIPFGDLDKGLLRSFGGLGDLNKIVSPDTMFPIIIRGPIDKPELDIQKGLEKLQENLGQNLLQKGLDEAFKNILKDGG